MTIRIVFLSISIVSLFLFLALGCKTLDGGHADELLTNPSIHIMVSDRYPAPQRGTYDFESKLFKIDDSVEFELAAVDARITAALEAELERRGFVRDRDKPDLRLSYAVAADAAISQADLNAAYADEFPIEVPAPPSGARFDYHRGVLICDFVDDGSRNLLWRGAIQADISANAGEDTKKRRVRQAVQTLLQHFPRPIAQAID